MIAPTVGLGTVSTNPLAVLAFSQAHCYFVRIVTYVLEDSQTIEVFVTDLRYPNASGISGLCAG